jgi:hypothetical protein
MKRTIETEELAKIVTAAVDVAVTKIVRTATPQTKAPSEDVQKALGEFGKVAESLGKLNASMTTLEGRLTALEAQPRPGGPALRAVDKVLGAETISKSDGAIDDAEDALLVKMINDPATDAHTRAALGKRRAEAEMLKMYRGQS